MNPIEQQEMISGIPENHTVVEKIASATDILNGNSVADGDDTTGGTMRMDDRNPDEVIDTPTEQIESANAKKALPIIAVVIIGIIFIGYVLLRRK